MGKFKVMFTDNVFGISDLEKERYDAVGYEFVEASAIDEETLIRECKDMDAVVTCYAQMTERVLKSMDHCKLIMKAGMGVNNLDIEAATALGIMVANVEGYCLDEVADHGIALTLALVRKVAFMDRRVRSGLWEGAAPSRPIRRISELEYGIYGLGKIGTRIAKKAQGLGFKVIAYDPYLDDSVFEEYGVERITDEEEIFRRSDVLAVQLNLNKETDTIITYEKFKLMKPSAYFINVARGGLVDEPGLIKALQEGTIAGAGLDVLVEEHPDMSSPLFQMENVCITPHAAYYSTSANIDVRHKACDQVIGALEHGAPEYFVNREALGR